MLVNTDHVLTIPHIRDISLLYMPYTSLHTADTVIIAKITLHCNVIVELIVSLSTMHVCELYIDHVTNRK